MDFIWTEKMDSPAHKDALAVRKKVFVGEQNVPLELEVDDLEDQTLHVVGYLDNKPVATARIYEKYPHTYKIQRVAVDSAIRGQKRGVQLMLEVEKKVKEMGGKAMVLDAQDYAMPFYEKLGFSISDEKGFMDAGIPHHSMKKEWSHS